MRGITTENSVDADKISSPELLKSGARIGSSTDRDVGNTLANQELGESTDELLRSGIASNKRDLECIANHGDGYYWDEELGTCSAEQTT